MDKMAKKAPRPDKPHIYLNPRLGAWVITAKPRHSGSMNNWLLAWDYTDARNIRELRIVT